MKYFILICAIILYSCTDQRSNHQILLSSKQCGYTYNRIACFGSWIDEDHDGLNTREEVLLLFKTPTGEYQDIYTGKLYSNSSILDADHIVPLKWAWDHGAKYWEQEKRIQLANDLDNVVLTYRSVNRSKGDKGICEWTPEINKDQYVHKFMNIINKYNLEEPKCQK